MARGWVEVSINYALAAVAVAVVCILAWLLRRRRGSASRPYLVGAHIAEAATTAYVYDVAVKFLATLGNISGGLLVLPEAYPLNDYVRLHGQTYDEMLNRDDVDRVAAETFDRKTARWSESQRAAIGRFEEESPQLLGLLERHGIAVDLNILADVLLATQLIRLARDPIEKNHSLIVDRFLAQQTNHMRTEKQLIKDFLRFADETDLFPHAKEIAARLCVLRAIQPLYTGTGTLRDLCEGWGHEWAENFPGRYIADPTPYYNELNVELLRHVFARLGRKIPKLQVGSGVYQQVVDEYELDRYQETLESGSAPTISDMVGL